MPCAACRWFSNRWTDLEHEPFIWVNGGIFQELPLLQGTASGVVTMISADGSYWQAIVEGCPPSGPFRELMPLPGTNGEAILLAMSDDGSTISVRLTRHLRALLSQHHQCRFRRSRGADSAVVTISSLGEVIEAAVRRRSILSWKPLTRTFFALRATAAKALARL